MQGVGWEVGWGCGIGVQHRALGLTMQDGVQDEGAEWGVGCGMQDHPSP